MCESTKQNGQTLRGSGPADGKIVWWNPDAVSTYNGQRGAWESDGQRYQIGQIPAKAAVAGPAAQ